jgi:hypothetical protein
VPATLAVQPVAAVIVSVSPLWRTTCTVVPLGWPSTTVLVRPAPAV